MKITLFNSNPDVERVADFLERNLRKAKITVKDLDDKKVSPGTMTAEVDGKIIEGEGGYKLLKEIKKIVKKDAKVDNLDKEELKKFKEELEMEKEARNVGMLVTATIKGEELTLEAPFEDFDLDEMTLRVIYPDGEEIVYEADDLDDEDYALEESDVEDEGEEAEASEEDK